jgi:hypothetical protein
LMICSWRALARTLMRASRELRVSAAAAMSRSS